METQSPSFLLPALSCDAGAAKSDATCLLRLWLFTLRCLFPPTILYPLKVKATVCVGACAHSPFLQALSQLGLLDPAMHTANCWAHTPEGRQPSLLPGQRPQVARFSQSQRKWASCPQPPPRQSLSSGTQSFILIILSSSSLPDLGLYT